MATSKLKSGLSTTRALRRFGFRQTIRGALIIGLLTGIMMGAQGAAYAAAYPDQHSRDIFVTSLKSVPSLGFMAGEIDDALTPASYSIYKSIALTTLITGIWGLLVTTKLFRGQEEDGRLEPILSGHTTKAAAGIHMLIGFFYSLMVAILIAWLFIAGLGMDPKVGLDAGHAALLTLGVFLPAIFFGSLGVLTSQLALTRGRAMAYALVPLLVLFVIRGSANSISDWNWLKQYSPFGWTDLLNAVRDPHVIWIIPTFVFALLAIPLAIYFMQKRDYGESIIPQSTYARSRFFLLGSDLQLGIRQNIVTFLAWCVGTLAFAGLLASISKVAADALSSSPAFVQIIGKLGGSYEDIVIAFIGFGGLFVALILLVMTSVSMGNVRAQEAKGYLDNFLIQPLRRSSWLAKRLALIVAMTYIISLLTGYIIWQIASAQGIFIDLGNMLQNATALMGAVVLLLGIGALFYGALPRFTTIGMLTVVIWAFIVDLLKSLFELSDWIDKTSILHYVSFAPTKTPDWTQLAWLVCIGLVLMFIGIWRFTQRDIVNE